MVRAPSGVAGQPAAGVAAGDHYDPANTSVAGYTAAFHRARPREIKMPTSTAGMRQKQ